MAGEADFKGNPRHFLRKDGGRIVEVPMSTDSACRYPGVFHFRLTVRDAVNSQLEQALPGDEESIKAYYLPWQKYVAMPLVLGGEAEFFFTSHFTDCRFTVKGDLRKPTVVHVSGATPRTTGGDVVSDRTKRNAMEEAAGIVGRARRFSTSEAMLHGYRGQKGPLSRSAFVFGQRVEETWQFWAQVVDANMAVYDGKGKIFRLVAIHELAEADPWVPRTVKPATD